MQQGETQLAFTALVHLFELSFGLQKKGKLTVRDASQGLVEGGCVAVVGERDAHSSRQKPPGQREGLFVEEEPGPEALVAHLIALQQQQQQQHQISAHLNN